MNGKKEQAKKETFQKSQLPAILKKQDVAVVGDGKDDHKAILCMSAKDFTELLHTMEGRFDDRKLKRIHDFNSAIALLGDRYDLTPEEMLFALTLLAKYIALHSNISGGVRFNQTTPLVSLHGLIDRLSKGKV